jgi:ABC-type protease/lipase transport system fused ATPase/permease subunit
MLGAQQMHPVMRSYLVHVYTFQCFIGALAYGGVIIPVTVDVLRDLREQRFHRKGDETRIRSGMPTRRRLIN